MRHRRLPAVLLLAVMASMGVFIAQGHTGLSLQDEGFLWYGVQRTLAGEIPIRDFMAYDPARYYIAAALIKLTGSAPGIVAVRAIESLFQAGAIAIGLWLITRARDSTSVGEAMVGIALLILWMYPRHKLFDIATCMALLGSLTLLMRRGTAGACFGTGVVVGFAAVVLRNHGLYGALASFAAILYLVLIEGRGPRLRSAIALWMCGIVVGYSPVLLLLFLAPGFAAEFFETIRFLVEYGATNLTIPVPWPWRVSYAAPTVQWIPAVLLGIAFTGIVAYATAAVVVLAVRALQHRSVAPEIAACALLSLPYAHLALSRADQSHLAQGIFPCLVGTMIAMPRRGLQKWLAMSLLLLGSAILMVPAHPGWECVRANQCESIAAGPDKLVLPSATQREVRFFQELDARFAQHERTLYAAPFWPGAYALLGKKAPVWEIYPLVRRSATFEATELERMARHAIGFAVLSDTPLDGREDRRFGNTHPLINEYVRTHWRPQAQDSLPGVEVFVAP